MSIKKWNYYTYCVNKHMTLKLCVVQESFTATFVCTLKKFVSMNCIVLLQ